MAISTALTFVLPYWQSKIVNIGLVQDGIEYVAPEKISNNTFVKIQNLLNDNTLFENSYSIESDGNYKLNNDGKKNITNLDAQLTNPFAYISYSNENNLQIQNNLYNEFILNTEPGLIKQLAIQECKNEMHALDVDIFSLQINYISGQGVIVLLFIILYSIIGYCITYINNKISLNIAYEKRNSLFESIINFSNNEINKFGEASLLTRTTNDISIIQSFASMIMSTLLSAPITIIVGFFFAYITAPELSWIVIVAALAIFIAAIISVKLLSPIFSKIQNLLDYINLVTRYILSGVFTTKTWNQIKTEEKKFSDANKPLYDTQLLIGRILSVVNPLLVLGTSAVSILILILGGIYIDIGTIQVGDLIAFSSYSLIIISSFTSLGMFIGGLPRCNVALQRIEEVINTKPILDVSKKTNYSEKAIDNTKYNIKLEDVWYSYKQNSNYEIKNINLSINNGETLAIVGETGSGKTTLLQLIMHLSCVSKGLIKLNGENIENIPVEEYYELFAYAPQESFLFSGSLKDNLLYGNKQKSNKKKYVDEIIKQTQLENFVSNNNKNIDTQIAQDSINISGGQRQRISIARALASQRPILVFDDCFTSLDYKVERKIVDSIYKNYPNTTKIIASSRISNIINADNIICMFQGQIVGQGSFNKLLKSCPEFVKIVKSQKQSVDLFTGCDEN